METSEYEVPTLKVVHSIITLPISLIKIADYLAVTGKEVYSYLCMVNLMIPLQQTGKLMQVFVMFPEKIRGRDLSSHQKYFQNIFLYILTGIEQYVPSLYPQLKHVSQMYRTNFQKNLSHS